MNLEPQASAPTGSAGSIYYDSVDTNFKYHDGGGWKDFGGASSFTTTEYSNTIRITGTKTTNMGEHDFCVLSAVGGPGGFDCFCKVSKTGNDWTLWNQDNSSNESNFCGATCFDYD